MRVSTLPIRRRRRWNQQERRLLLLFADVKFLWWEMFPALPFWSREEEDLFWYTSIRAPVEPSGFKKSTSGGRWRTRSRVRTSSSKVTCSRELAGKGGKSCCWILHFGKGGPRSYEPEDVEDAAYPIFLLHLFPPDPSLTLSCVFGLGLFFCWCRYWCWL